MKLISAGIHLCAILCIDGFANGPVHSASQYTIKKNLRNRQFEAPSVKDPLITYAPSTSTQRTALTALAIDSAQEGAWKAYVDDEETGLIFYYNHQTGESIWRPPSPSFPKVQPSGFLEERMTDVRKKYLGTLSLKYDQAGPWHSMASVLGFQNKKDSQPAENKDLASSFLQQSKRMNPMENIVNALSSLNLDDILGKINGDSSSDSDSDSNSSTNSNNAKENNLQDQKKTNDKNSEPPKRDDKFDFAQRIESTKAGLTGLVAGGTSLIPFTIFQALVNDSSNKSLQFLFDTGSGAVEAALFAIVYRYCVRDGEESNEQLGQGVWGAFAITRALSAGNRFDFLDAEMIQQIAFSGVESFAMFGAAKLAMDFVAQKGFVKRME